MSGILAVDLGGSALKACLFGIGGEEIATAHIPLTFDEDASGRSEQEPDLWWNALASATAEIAAKSPAGIDDIAAVSICGFTRTQVILDQANNVLRPAFGFRDSRAVVAAENARAGKRAAMHSDAKHLNTFHPLARLLWVKENEPKVWAAAHLVLEPKDYLNLRLTGRAMSDHISQFWLRTAMCGEGASLAALAGVSKNLLPPIGNPEHAVGAVIEGLPGPMAQLAGAIVLCGSVDAWAAVAGLGALKTGRAYCISGSSEVFGLLTDRNAEAEGLATIPWGENIWQIGGPGQNGANALGWIVDCLDRRDLPLSKRFDDLLQVPASGQPLIFHPFLHGERAPFWDRDLRASFLGLGASHGPADLVRAVMEGIAFLNRTVLERAEQAAQHRASEVRIAGGGARSPVWNQIRADILGRPVLAAPDREMGLAGCLALARFGLGIDDDIAAAADAVATDFGRFDSDPLQRERLDALYSVFSETHAAVADASHRLARIGRNDFDDAQ